MWLYIGNIFIVFLNVVWLIVFFISLFIYFLICCCNWVFLIVVCLRVLVFFLLVGVMLLFFEGIEVVWMWVELVVLGLVDGWGWLCVVMERWMGLCGVGGIIGVWVLGEVVEDDWVVGIVIGIVFEEWFGWDDENCKSKDEKERDEIRVLIFVSGFLFLFFDFFIILVDF